MILQAHHLTAERNERCLFRDLNFTLNPGDVLQVVGSNGAGKTTLLRIISGLLPAVEGTVSGLPEFIYIGHQAGVKGGLTPQENLQFATRLAGYPTNKQAIDTALHTVGLQGYEQVETHTLSMGQQRRVGLARLILIPACLWILDEPLTALDTNGIAIIENLIRQHIRQQGMVLMTSHQSLHLEGMIPQLLVLDA